MNLPPVLRTQYVNSNGAPLVGGQLFSYQAGTTTPQATYTDSGGLTPNANPVILDANGSASVWLDPTLSYKFILQDVNGVTQFSVDSVVGTLTANAVNTAALQNLSVTTPKMALLSVDSTILKSDATVDANRAVTTNSIQNGVVTTQKLTTIRPCVQKFTSGSGTFYRSYAFVVASSTAAAGDTYTNNGVTFTVIESLTSGTVLYAWGNGAPSTSGNMTRATGSGTATIAFTSANPAKYGKGKFVAGGGGGSGGGSSAPSTGTIGGATTFGTITCNPGTSGAQGSVAAAGGTASLGTGPVGFALQGNPSSGITSSSTVSGSQGGTGGASPFLGAGAGGYDTTAATAAAANTGSGGGGGGCPANSLTGQSGSSGGYAEAVLDYSIVGTSLAYSIGAGGGSGAAGGGGNGGDGGSGYAVVEDYFQ